MGIEIFKKHLREKRAIKVSVDTLDVDLASKICRAAQAGRASAIDIPCSKEIYEIARKNSKLPIFASSIHPFEILNAVKMGVDAIQIGNYWELYKKGKYFTAQEAYDVILETLGLINDYDVFTCVTIPASIKLDEQIELVHKLDVLGVDLIQTEGYKKVSSSSFIVKSAPDSIMTMIDCHKHSRVPMMTSCAMNTKALGIAFQKGANAVAVGSSICNLPSEVAMKTVIMEMVATISYRNSINREMVRTKREMARIDF